MRMMRAFRQSAAKYAAQCAAIATRVARKFSALYTVITESGMLRTSAALAGLGVALLVAGLLARPYLHAVRADRITVELGIRIAPSERARLLDAQVLAGIESRALGRELKLRLNHPARRASLAPFLLDRCEVRQIDFERFVQWREKSGAGAPLRSISSGHRIAGLLHSPATGVDFVTAARYCAAAGGRLPWAEELEAAAAGKDGRLYAWGNHFDPGAWPYLDGWRNAARACGAYPPSDSPQGVHDLNGNAMEWSAGSMHAHGEARQTAAHGAPAVRARARGLYALNAAWLTIPPNTRSHHLGFRCAYDAPPPAQLAWRDQPGAVALIEGGEYPFGLPHDVRLARLALILPDEQLREARQLLALGERAAPRIAVGRCEVSRREYLAFLNDPLARAGLFANPQQPAEETYVPANWERQSRAPELPVVGVSWWAADAFARWAGGRLPR
ncbi:MAG: SUMF1/EgtB/PvdO family nonheme iron enzyme, partial [Gammaproteobacteria bacterium]